MSVTTGDELSSTVKFIELVIDWPFTVTVIGPVVEPTGTCTVILVSELADGVTPAPPLKDTKIFAGVVEKFVPVMVTLVRTIPLVGLKLVIVGGGTIVKFDDDVAV